MKQVFLLIISITLFSCHSPKESPANASLRRILGDVASKFVLTELGDKSENDWFEIRVVNNQVHITANSQVALCKGAYTYIIDNGFGVISWEGTNVNIPDQLEDKEYSRITSSMPLRMYINPCTYGYSMAWWDWQRWEKELDWMAMHGINMPLALLGQEIVWQEIWEEMGIEKTKLDDYYCGPAFLPWFRMGNLYNHIGPLPQSRMEEEKNLQKKIMKRMKELGMHPVVPAFSGHVPPYFKQMYPESTIYELENWGGIESEKASYLLDPKDTLFTVIGKKFLKLYEETYGKADLFLADAFNEMLPPVSDENKDEELAGYGEAIYKSIKEHNPDANWVIQGWTFGHQGYFWTSESTKAFFSRIPKDNLLMLNYGEDRYSIWEKLDAFYGFKWTYGYVHNYGGQQSLFGDLNFYHDKYIALMDNPDKGNLVGYGCLPEGIENNSIVYDYIFDVPWGGTQIAVTDWVNRYIQNRYGVLSKNAEEAWKVALENTYAVKEWKTSRLGYGTYIHNNRPGLNTDIRTFHGNPEAMATILDLLLKDYEIHKDNELYFYDIIDFAQHYTAYLADLHLVRATEHFKKLEFSEGDEAFEMTKNYLGQLEILQAATGGSFTTWCEDAIAQATSENEKALYLRNAKTQITIWGGNRLKDYASKSWAGILSDFYIPRWQIFFDEIKHNKENFDEVSAQNKIREMEENWTLSSSIPSSPKMLTKDEYMKLVTGLLDFHHDLSQD